MKLVLASNSPRRRELLASIITQFDVVPSSFEERAEGLSARETALAFAEGKAGEVFSRFPDCVVLGSDTVVALGGEVLGKPKDREDAVRTLRALSGKTHSVYTGVCLAGAFGKRSAVAETRVTFYRLSEKLIGEYVASGLPLDKAGSYGIQDGYPLVEKYEGSYSNAVGLPVALVKKLLKEVNLC